MKAIDIRLCVEDFTDTPALMEDIINNMSVVLGVVPLHNNGVGHLLPDMSSATHYHGAKFDNAVNEIDKVLRKGELV